MTECTWPIGCFQQNITDDPDGVCSYHRKVLDGLITPALPDTAEEELVAQRKRNKSGGRTPLPGMSAAELDPPTVEYG